MSFRLFLPFSHSLNGFVSLAISRISNLIAEFGRCIGTKSVNKWIMLEFVAHYFIFFFSIRSFHLISCHWKHTAYV